MSISYIPERTRLRLWGKAAGRCEYEGCNQLLWVDPLTQVEFNIAYIAHIVADSPEGPRGDAILSDQLKAELSNLMLLCDVHHRLVDRAQVVQHPVERLTQMKALHEARVELITALGPEKQSHVLLYGANVGVHSSPVSYEKAAAAMLPDRYPAELRPISLGLVNSSLIDRNQQYWQVESLHLSNMIAQQVRPRLAFGAVPHLSICALAPQPLLMLLGFLLSDIPAAEVYQLHREPPDWKWQPHTEGSDFVVSEPTNPGDPALVFSISATVTDDRIHAVLNNPAIWKITVPSPNNDVLKSRKQARQFRETARTLMDRIKARHGQHAQLHVFPAMPAALAVEFGRILMPKADLSLIVYDENRGTGGFTHALDLNA